MCERTQILCFVVNSLKTSFFDAAFLRLGFILRKVLNIKVGSVSKNVIIHKPCYRVLFLTTPAGRVCYPCKESVLPLQGEYALSAGRVIRRACEN